MDLTCADPVKARQRGFAAANARRTAIVVYNEAREAFGRVPLSDAGSKTIATNRAPDIDAGR